MKAWLKKALVLEMKELVFAILVLGESSSIKTKLLARRAEYLRIIYSLEYSLPEHLERLKQRGLTRKRCSALR
ncbi:hypothetical protein [Pleurocapsa sp. FMAR1]|uniref:hypothetical protein n=1 Tax=Pleurocapsa sp. FMAR1 TaxID=3040204 RepID=UPI0039AF75A3